MDLQRSARVAEAHALRESLLQEEREQKERERLEAIERENRDKVEAEKARRQAAEQKAYRLAMLDLMSAQDHLVKVRVSKFKSNWTFDQA